MSGFKFLKGTISEDDTLPEPSACPNCGSGLGSTPDASPCPGCGSSLGSADMPCPGCGSSLGTKGKPCPNCGSMKATQKTNALKTAQSHNILQNMSQALQNIGAHQQLLRQQGPVALAPPIAEIPLPPPLR